VPREIKDMLLIACNPPQQLLQRRPKFCTVSARALQLLRRRWLTRRRQVRQPWRVKVMRCAARGVVVRV
jgi:hypothetical protein